MSRSQFLILTLMMTIAVIGGALVATVVPRMVTNAEAQELKLAPAPQTTAAVVVPSFADIVEKALPSVVQIRASEIVNASNRGSIFDDPNLRRFFRQDEDDEDNSGSEREMIRGAGSGFVFTTDGYVLTNKHVVEDGDRFVVTTSNDEEFEANLVGTDPYLDLAVLKVQNARNLPALPLGSSSDLRVGEWVIAIGNPLIFRNSVTVGVVSGKGRDIERGPSSLGRYIQTDAAINFGNSGGPLLNTHGEVIGINTAIIRNSGAFGSVNQDAVDGIGFALPITDVTRILDELVASGTVRRGYLGVSARDLDEAAASFYGIPGREGALLATVEPGTPAADAGLQEEDVVLSVDGTNIGSSQELVSAISSKSPGDRVKVELWREGKAVTKTVRLGERRVGLENASAPVREMEEEPRESGSASGLGFTVEPLSSRQRSEIERDGVLVTEVEPRSNAGDAGLIPGDVILEINRKTVDSLSSYRDIVRKIDGGEAVRLKLLRNGQFESSIFFFAPE